MDPQRVGLIMPAAGRGLRLGAGDPKAFRPLGGRTILQRAFDGVRRSGSVGFVVLVVPAELVERSREELRTNTADGDGCVSRCVVVAGGETRQDSVRAGLAALPPQIDIVLVHDAARCLAPATLFTRVAEAVRDGAAAVVPGVALVDTVKEVDHDVVVATPERARLMAVQTPQGFRRELLERAHRAVGGTQPATDDAALVEALGEAVRIVPGDEAARKITRSLDLVLAEAMLAAETP